MGKAGFQAVYAMVQKMGKKNLVADMCKCTRCGLCQKQCPVNNIKVDKDSITFFENCVSCSGG